MPIKPTPLTFNCTICGWHHSGKRCDRPGRFLQLLLGVWQSRPDHSRSLAVSRLADAAAEEMGHPRLNHNR